MAKKRAGGLLGTLLIAGVAAGVVKYLKDYSNTSFTDEEQINKVKKNTSEVKDAARRTYVAIKEKRNVKEAAEDLAKAAGAVVSDSANIAKTAGAGAVKAAKDIKAKFDEDPEAAREEVINNLKDMGSGISQKVSETAEEVVERFRGEEEFTDFEDSDFDDVVQEDTPAEAPAEAEEAECGCQTAEDVLEGVKKAAEEAVENAEETASEVAAEAAETVDEAAAAAKEAVQETKDAAEEAVQEAKDTAADAAQYVADKVEEESIETANILDELHADSEEAIAEAAEEATKVLNSEPSITITDDELD